MGRPLLARRPKGNSKKDARCDKDDAEVRAQQARKVALLEQMRARVNGRQTTSAESRSPSTT
ncbi:hypothetical protein [Streptomyces sp. NPDC058989]|uniref:hypothetical protein n=1 Tax=Streptomyces sp. NPDC058989 TaxID=3346686 RepID=UPI0036A1295C